MVYLAARVGPEAMWHAMRQCAPWFLLLVALEGGQLLLESSSTLYLLNHYHEGKHPMRYPYVLRAQIISYTLTTTLPAGRVGGELLKAALFSKHLPRVYAFAVAAACQALSLLGNASIALTCAVCVLFTADSPTLIAALLTFAVISASIGFLILSSGRAAALTWLHRLAPKLEHHARAFSEVMRGRGSALIFPWLIYIIARFCQVLQLGVIVHAMGGATGIVPAFIAQGVYLVGVGAGDLIPANLGTTEGAFALSGSMLGISAAQGVAVSLVVRAVQMSWVALSMVTPILWRLPKKV